MENKEASLGVNFKLTNNIHELEQQTLLFSLSENCYVLPTVVTNFFAIIRYSIHMNKDLTLLNIV